MTEINERDKLPQVRNALYQFSSLVSSLVDDKLRTTRAFLLL